MTKKTLMCSIEGCCKEVLAKSLCRVHYREALNRDRECEVDRCLRVPVAGKVCLMHYKRFERSGSYDDPKPREGHSELLPGYTRVNHDGYIRLVNYGVLDGKGNPLRIMEHRAVMEDALGRTLTPEENVHHKNGVRSDNRLENLELWVKMQPSGQRVEDLVDWAKEVLERYEPESLRLV